MHHNITKKEEDYLKGLMHLKWKTQGGHIGTNQLADSVGVAPATANSMLKKLKEKSWVDYKKYGSIKLTQAGENIALQLIRKHRLWETFLYDTLDFSWDEVHEVAEQLEHIRSEKLIEKLDQFLGYPTHDPHGDPIPDSQGKFKKQSKKTLAEMPVGSISKIVSVRDTSAAFLQYVSQLGMDLKTQIEILGKQDFDNSLHIRVKQDTYRVSEKFSTNVYVVPI
ncbi:metal-dependent transcriptional regulator [Membranicola marinus]|uniref:Transcriptional regulator MntR n=1 Tax=Membranihabitans marinus TaxID=1227546 RepID=A0A953HW78_9BACT|nr:metal-dependent transcriptional regulator [Membranihabitans marinus]MBY5957676.1 metal-dependent transcriptional regulator [Membranihabitans marinus]